MKNWYGQIFGNKRKVAMLRPVYGVFSMCVCLMVGGAGYAATIHVGPSHPITSVKQALAQAAPGDTIRVHGGIYREGNIEIRKAVALIGVGNPIIDGEKEQEPFSVFAPFVTISGFTIKASGQSSIRDIAAIKVYDTHHIIIADNTLDDNFFGIYLQGSRQCTVRNNQLTAYGATEQLTGNGIHGWKSDSLYIVGNTITGHRDGIYLEFVTHTEVRDNVAVDNKRYGLHFMFSHENGYYGNTFSRNGAGVAVMYTKQVRMENNVFSENWGDAAYGLLLKDITDSHIEHNVFLRNTTGILMEGSNRVQIQRNQFEGNGWAMKMQSSCMDNMLTQNNFVQNTFDLATNGSLKLNTFVRNYWDKYEGYDLDKDKEGDVPYRPVSLFSMVVEKYPAAMLLFRSFMVTLLDRTERVMPSLIPEDLKDDFPMMNPVAL
ncbi:nitrous oxide reductase family maturation protein NosD [Parapedobacter sp.]